MHPADTTPGPRETFLTARMVRERYGVSDVTLHRWLHSDSLNFPVPIRINRRRLWRLADLAGWEATRTGGADAHRRTA